MVEQDVAGLTSIYDLEIFDDKFTACMRHISCDNRHAVIHEYKSAFSVRLKRRSDLIVYLIVSLPVAHVVVEYASNYFFVLANDWEILQRRNKSNKRFLYARYFGNILSTRENKFTR